MCHLRLWCPFMGHALRMCDYIFPRRLLIFVGPHLAHQTTYCYSRESIKNNHTILLTHKNLTDECVHHVKTALDNLIKSPGFFDTEVCFSTFNPYQ